MRFLLIAGLFAAAAQGAAAAPCASSSAGVRELLASEYAFAERARASLRQSFLEFTSADAWTLAPAPMPAHALFEARVENADRLTWYPAQADISVSGDVGFTTGPFEFASASGALDHGQFVTIWRREPDCRWLAVFDAGISHPAEPLHQPLDSQHAVASDPGLKPTYGGVPAADQAVIDFENTASREGLAQALHVYARNRDFELFVEGNVPMDLVAADRLLTAHVVKGEWLEAHRLSAADATLRYTVGSIRVAKRAGSMAYLQLWQYDPTVANWGLKLLLLTQAPR